MTLADVEQCGLDALLLDHLAVHDGEAEGRLVEGESGIEVSDGDPDMIDRGEHARQCR
jgi:hypothetical protein